MNGIEVTEKNTSSWLLGLDPRCLFNQQSLKIQAVRKDIISNIVTPHAEMIQSHWIFSLQCKFHSLQVCIHTNIHTCIIKSIHQSKQL
jgi:hypothetical protein